MSIPLRITGLRKRYRAVEALAGVDLEIGPGELVGLLGPNGSGKSTLVKSVCGLVRPTAGAIEVCGAPAGTRAARASIGYLAETFRFPGWMTAAEVLTLHRGLAERPEPTMRPDPGEPWSPGEGRDPAQHLDRAQAAGATTTESLLERVGLGGHARTRVAAMSKGMQQRLGIAQALVGSPRLVLLDEPTSALDPVGRRIVRELLEELRAQQVAVLLNSHLLGEVELVCDRVVILRHGRLVAQGRPRELGRAQGVEVETEQGLTVVEGAVRADVPRIVADLVAAGRDVYGVRVLSSTLEEVYLEAVEGEVS